MKTRGKYLAKIVLPVSGWLTRVAFRLYCMEDQAE